MAYVDFPTDLKGQKDRKAFWTSENGISLIAGWRSRGIPMKKVISDFIGVSGTAFYGWYRECEELRKACAISAEILDSKVETSLFKRAIGYYYDEDTYELVEGELMLVRRNHKYLPPDVRAIHTWLFNRMPGRWRAVQEPLESTQYKETIQEILVAMKEVAGDGGQKKIDFKENEEINTTYVLEDD